MTGSGGPLEGRRIVYLSPNAPRAFRPGEFDHNAAYVAGGIVDKAVRRPVTVARARRSGKVASIFEPKPVGP